jgi:hypothetical protein
LRDASCLRDRASRDAAPSGESSASSFLAGAEHVGDVEERGALYLRPEIDERCLHAGQHTRHFSTIDVSDDSFLSLPFDKELSQGAILDDRDADLGALGVHREHVVHLRLCANRCVSSGASRHECRSAGSG